MSLCFGSGRSSFSSICYKCFSDISWSRQWVILGPILSSCCSSRAFMSLMQLNWYSVVCFSISWPLSRSISISLSSPSEYGRTISSAAVPFFVSFCKKGPYGPTKEIKGPIVCPKVTKFLPSDSRWVRCWENRLIALGRVTLCYCLRFIRMAFKVLNEVGLKVLTHTSALNVPFISVIVFTGIKMLSLLDWLITSANIFDLLTQYFCTVLCVWLEKASWIVSPSGFMSDFKSILS